MTRIIFNKNSRIVIKKCFILTRTISYILPSFLTNIYAEKGLLYLSKFSKPYHTVVHNTQKSRKPKHLHLINRLCSDFKLHKYAPEVEKSINIQIQAEQQAAQDYLSIAVIFLHVYQSRPGIGGYFMRMFDEEIEHMQELVQYQLLRGGVPAICGLTAPKPKRNITMLEAFRTALAKEIFVTELLEKIVNAAEAVKDYQCADYITSTFLQHQMESVNDMAHHVSKVSRLCDEHGLYQYDLWLGKQYPWSHNKKADKR